MKVKLLREKNLQPNRYDIGDIVDVPKKIGERWIDKKIAIEVKEIKTKNKKGIK